MTGITSGTILK